MSLRIVLVFVWFGIAASFANAAGIGTIIVPGDANGPEIKAVVWTPCSLQPAPISMGPIAVLGTRGCPVLGENLPLVVISHGHGGSSLGHHDTAEALADAGFIVVALNHPGDNYADMSRSGDIAAMVERPTDIKRLIDFMLTASPYSSKIDRERIGFFGFSRGGYTGLVLAGAEPDFHDPSIPCPEGAPICGEILRNELPAHPLTRDDRIKAFVLADPLSFFPDRRSLQGVHAPIQLWRSQFGGDGVLPRNVATVAANLPTQPEFHDVPGSGHFAFLVPCSPALTAAQPEICIDQNGFDRGAFHRMFDDQIVAFFKTHLAQPE